MSRLSTSFRVVGSLRVVAQQPLGRLHAHQRGHPLAGVLLAVEEDAGAASRHAALPMRSAFIWNGSRDTDGGAFEVVAQLRRPLPRATTPAPVLPR